MKKRILCGLMSLLFVLGVIPVSVFAENNIEKKASGVLVNKIAGIAANEELPNDYIQIDYPKNKTIFYKGEVVKYKTHGTNCYFNNGNQQIFGTVVDYRNTKGKEVTKELFVEDITSKETFSYTKSFSTKDMKPGYYFGFYSIVLDDPFAEESPSQQCANLYAVIALKKPTRLKAKAGKKKVTVTFRKATGGTSYEIYRSTKKTKGYKKIKTTKSAKYVDKKVKKKKRYYYKVRTVRNAGRGTVRSGFTSPVRSGKVK